jgi:hypothetical protein
MEASCDDGRGVELNGAGSETPEMRHRLARRCVPSRRALKSFGPARLQLRQVFNEQPGEVPLGGFLSIFDTWHATPNLGQLSAIQPYTAAARAFIYHHRLLATEGMLEQFDSRATRT